MRKPYVFVVFLLCLLAGIHGVAKAELRFAVDFGQDGVNEIAWKSQADETVVVDIYVSSVPDPGLVSMGFVLDFDPTKLEVIAVIPDATNWLFGTTDDSTEGRIDIAGIRVSPGLAGDDILLGTVTFRCLVTGGSELRLFDRDVLSPGTDIDSFVSADGTVLDDDIAGGLFLGIVTTGCVSDFDFDGDADGFDLVFFSNLFLQGSGNLADVAAEFGQLNCF